MSLGRREFLQLAGAAPLAASPLKLSAGTAVRIPELKFDPFGKPDEGWVKIAPIWYQKGTGFGDDRIIVEKISGKVLKE